MTKDEGWPLYLQLFLAAIVVLAATSVVTIFVSPSAAQSPPRQRWEYKTEPAQNTVGGADAKYNFLGKDGWEMCGIDGKFVYFKRPGS